MSTKKELMQRFARHCREQEGRDLTMREVAVLAVKAGWKPPTPKDPLDIMAKEFAIAAREETRIDEVTLEPYRANISYEQKQGDEQITLWGDIDRSPRKNMVKHVHLRREQMVGDGLHLSYDVKHWNRVNADQEPIQLELDLTDDVQWRMNAPRGDDSGEKDAA